MSTTLRQPTPKSKTSVGAEEKAATSWPAPKIRTAVSLLLFMHLFALAVGFLLSESSSPLRVKLRRFPGFYQRLLAMDFDLDTGLGYESITQRDRNKSRRALMHLTHAGIVDVPYFTEFEFQKDGQSKTVRWPEEGLSGYRLHHYQMLTWEMGRLVGGENAEAVLPGAIAGQLMRENGVTRGTIRARRLTLTSPVEALSAIAAQRDPWHETKYQTAYEALAWISGDEVLLTRSAAVGEVAPVANPNQRRPAGTTRGAGASMQPPSQGENAPANNVPAGNAPQGNLPPAIRDPKNPFPLPGDLPARP